MNTKRILMLLFCAGVIGSAMIGSPHQVHAQDATASKTTFSEGLVQVIAQKFNLDRNQVQSIVADYRNQERTKMQAARQKRQEERLAQLVADGKITSAQKDAIIKEQAALKAKYSPESMKTMTPDQRKAQMTALRNEAAAWAKSQGIDPAYLIGPMGMKHAGRWMNQPEK